MKIYIDESGDLGWTFDRPYRDGGSSRFLTISFLLAPNGTDKYPKRLMSKFRQHFRVPPGVEVKANKLSDDRRDFFVRKTLDMLQNHPEITINTITVQKTNVEQHIRDDGNKLYNYMASLSLLDDLVRQQQVCLIPDPRTLKVKSGNSFIDYLQTKLWFERTASTMLRVEYMPSDQCANLQFADIIANIIWRKYEDGSHTYADLLIPHINCKRLFFR